MLCFLIADVFPFPSLFLLHREQNFSPLRYRYDLLHDNDWTLCDAPVLTSEPQTQTVSRYPSLPPIPHYSGPAGRPLMTCCGDRPAALSMNRAERCATGRRRVLIASSAEVAMATRRMYVIWSGGGTCPPPGVT